MGCPKWYADGRIVCISGKQDCAEMGLEGRAEKICEWHNSEVDALQADNARLREALEELRDMQVVETLPIIEAALAPQGKVGAK